MGKGRYVIPGSPDFEAMVTNNLADDQRRNGQYEEAERLFMKAIGIWEAEERDFREQIQTCHFSLGVLNLARGDLAKAADHIDTGCQLLSGAEAAVYLKILQVLRTGDARTLRDLQEQAKHW